MELYLIIIVFLGCSSCSNLDPIFSVSHETDLIKQDYGDKFTFANDYEYFGRNPEYGKINIEDDDNGKDVRIQSDTIQNDKVRQRYNAEEMKKLDKIFGYTGPTANDEPENLERPCALDDWACIRKYFAANGKCKPAYGPIPDPLFQDVVTFFLPNSNVTLVLTNLQIRGLSTAKITTFYVNKKTGNLVIAFDVQNLNLVIPRTYLRYRRTAKESIILAGFATANFRSSTYTAVIPQVPDLSLELADSHADVQDGTPTFFVNPEITASTDPDVLTGFASVLANLPISLREFFLFESQFITALYIQKNICDFGLKLISV